MLQWHYKAAEPPGDCRTESGSPTSSASGSRSCTPTARLPRDQGFKNLVWDYEHDDPRRARSTASPTRSKMLKEINGYYTGRPGQHLAGFADAEGRRLDDLRLLDLLRRLSRARPEPRRRSKQPDPPGAARRALNWGYAWPANRRMLYNRASADPSGQAVERAEEVGLVGRRASGRLRRAGFRRRPRRRRAQAKPDGIGLDAQSGTDPFIMKADGKGWLFVPTGWSTARCPTHYEPAESPVRNPLYQQQSSPVLKYWKRRRQPAGGGRRSAIPVRDHHLPADRALPLRRDEPLAAVAGRAAAGAVRRDQPRAGRSEKGISNLDWVRVSHSARRRSGPRRWSPAGCARFTIDGKTIHQVGMPWHWGYKGS